MCETLYYRGGENVTERAVTVQEQQMTSYKSQIEPLAAPVTRVQAEPLIAEVHASKLKDDFKVEAKHRGDPQDEKGRKLKARDL